MTQYKTKLRTISILSEPTEHNSIKIKQSSDVVAMLKKVWPNDIGIRESFFVIFTNRINRTIGFELISSGGTCGTVVDNKLIFSSALGCLAQGIILAHNHPSGNVRPSSADMEITKKIKEAGKLLDITLLDHVILSPDFKHYSFADEGML